MNLLLKYTILALFILNFQITNALENSNTFFYGINLSAGVSEYTGYNSASWHGGISASYTLNQKRNFRLTAEFNYAHRNYLRNEEFHYDGLIFGPLENLESYSIYTNHIEIPILLSYFYTPDLFFSAGLKNSLLLKARHKNLDIIDWGRVRVPQNNENITEYFNSVDFSLILSKGITFDAGNFLFCPSFYFQYGISETGGQSLEHFKYDSWIPKEKEMLKNWKYYYVGIKLILLTQ